MLMNRAEIIFFFSPAMHSAGVKDQDAVLLTQNAKCILLLELSHPLIVNQILRCSSSPSPPASASFSPGLQRVQYVTLPHYLFSTLSLQPQLCNFEEI